MQVLDQTLEDVVASLSPLFVEWMDHTAAGAIAKLVAIPKKNTYRLADIANLFEGDFEQGLLCCRLFYVYLKIRWKSNCEIF